MSGSEQYMNENFFSGLIFLNVVLINFEMDLLYYTNILSYFVPVERMSK